MNNNGDVFEKKTNGFAIAGLICSILVGSITGLIFSFIGLFKAKTCNSGKGMSIAGIIISVLRIVLLVVLVIFSIKLVTSDEDLTIEACESLYDMKEQCTKNDDGTYQCFILKCDFDNYHMEVEEDEEVEYDEEIEHDGDIDTFYFDPEK